MRALSRLIVVSSLTPGTTALYLIRAFREIGCQVVVVSDMDHPEAHFRRESCFDVFEFARQQRLQPDAVLFVEGGTRRLFPSGLERLDCLTAWYAIDSHLHLALHQDTARLFDATFVVHQPFVQPIASKGAEHVYWLPVAAGPEIFRGEAARDIDVAYVGSTDQGLHPERARLLNLIRDRYPRTYLGAASPERMVDIYNRAKVVFNRSVSNDINMRYFEAMGAGAALVTDRLRDCGVEQLFEPGRDFLEYTDDASLLQAIDGLLADDERRRRMAAEARERILARHTYRHRVQAVLEALDRVPRHARPGPLDYLPVYQQLRFPDGVLQETVRLLGALKQRDNRNFVFNAALRLLIAASALLSLGYRFRYRLRNRKLALRFARKFRAASTR